MTARHRSLYPLIKYILECVIKAITAKAVNNVVSGHAHGRNPLNLDGSFEHLFDEATAIFIADVGIYQHVEQHEAMVGSGPTTLGLNHIIHVQSVNNRVDHAHRLVGSNRIVKDWRPQ